MSKLKIKSNLCIKKILFFIYYNLLLIFAIFNKFDGTKKLFGSSEQFNYTDINGLINLFGNSDFGEFIKFGVKLAQTSSVVDTDSTRIWMQLAPPGQGTINAIIIKLFGINNFAIFYMLIVFLFWSILFLFITIVIRRVNLFTFLFSSLIITGPTVTDWILGNAIFGTEAISYAVFFIYIVYLYNIFFIKSNFTQKNLYLDAFILGLLVVVATSIRAQFIIILYLSILILFLWPIFYLYLIIFNLNKNSTQISKVVKFFKLNLLVLLTMLSFFYPYSNFSKNELNISFGSVNVQNIHFKNAWMKLENLDPGTPQMGYGWACRIDSARCNEISQNLYVWTYEEYRNPTLQTVINFPLRFFENRIEVFSRAWFGSDGIGALGNFESIPYGLFIVFLWLYVLFIYIKNKNFGKLIFLSVTSIILIIPYLFSHIEIRYLGSLKLLILIFLLLEFSSNKKLKSKPVLI